MSDVTQTPFTVNRNDLMECWMVLFSVSGSITNIMKALSNSPVRFVDTTMGDASHFVYDDDTDEPYTKEQLEEVLIDIGFVITEDISDS